MNEEKDVVENRKWAIEQNRSYAEREHDKVIDYTNRMNEAAINNANFALRTLVIINGGAAIAILAFLGSLVSANATEYVNKLPALVGPLMWFVWGTALAAVAAALAYFTNFSMASSSALMDHIWEHPWTKENKDSELWSTFSVYFHFATVIAAVLSLGFFLYGMNEISNSIAELAKKT